MKRYFFLVLVAAMLLACERSRTPVEKLSFEDLTKVVETCRKTGKIATDDYCKEANAVYGPEAYLRHERARVAKVLSDNLKVDMNVAHERNNK